jgi:excisionase family DNA binding protein
MDPRLNKKRLFRPDEVAIILYKSKRTIYRMIKDGRLNAVSYRGSSWIPIEELEKLKEGL